MGYAYALWEMQTTKDLDRITAAAKLGCETGRGRFGRDSEELCAPSCADRITHLVTIWDTFHSQKELLDFLFYVYGTTISSCDVFVAAYALFLWAKEDVYLCIKMAAMLGGDTDTIGCLAAVLCCTYSGGHNIPCELVDAVKLNNTVDFEHITDCVLSMRK